MTIISPLTYSFICHRGEMVDTTDSKSVAFGRAGSSPAGGTTVNPFTARCQDLSFISTHFFYTNLLLF